jgi:hypothetical protein
MKRMILISLLILMIGSMKLSAQYYICVGGTISITSTVPVTPSGGVAAHYILASGLSVNAPSVACTQVIGSRTYTYSSNSICPGNTYNFSVTCPTAGTFTIYLGYKWYDVSCNSGAPHWVENGSVTITVYPSVPAQPGSITGTASVCQGTSNVAYSTPAVANTRYYLWSYTGDGVSIDNATTRTPTLNFSGMATSGTLSVIAVNTCGSSTPSYFPITIKTVPTATPVITGNPSVCQGGTGYTYSFPAMGDATSYAWTYSGNGATINSPAARSTTINYSASASSGTLSAHGINECGNGPVGSIPVVVNPLPSTPGSIIGNTNVCENQGNTPYSVPVVTNATAYQWTYSGSGIVLINSSSRTPTISYNLSATSGTLSVKGTNSCGQGPASTVAITVSPLPADAGSISGSTTVCAGQSGVNYSVPAITNATSYLWTYSGNDVTIANGNSRIPSLNFGSSASSGTLTVTGINACGSGFQSSVEITVNPLPLAPVWIDGQISVCANSGTTYSTNSTYATSYNWSYSGTGVTYTNGSTSSPHLFFAPNASSGILSANGVNACGSSPAITQTINVAPLPGGTAVISGPSQVCAGQSNVTYTLSGLSNVMYYHWDYTGANAYLESNNTSANIVFYNNATSGLLIAYGYNNCGDGVADTLAITVKPIPSNAVSISGPATVCAGQTNVSYTALPIANAETYSWYYVTGSGVSFASQFSANPAASFAANATSGSIMVMGVNSCGTGQPVGFNVQVNPLPSQADAIYGSATPCAGASTNYNAGISNASTYVWSYSGQGASITNSTTDTPTFSFATNASSGTISVYGVNACGTGQAKTRNITISPLPAAAGAITGNTSVCAGSANQQYFIDALSNASSYAWNYSGSGVSISYSTTRNVLLNFSSNATSGTLSVHGVNSCGQGASSSISITILQGPAAAGIINGPADLCQGQSNIQYSTDLIAGATSYEWTFYGGGGTFTTPAAASTQFNLSYGATSGLLYVRGLNACGYGDGTSMMINIGTVAENPQSISGYYALCQGSDSVQYTIPEVSNASSYTWSYSGNGATILNNGSAAPLVSFAGNATSGTLSVYASNGCGNSSPSEFSITVFETPAAPVATPVQPGCSTTTGSIELTMLPAGNWTINPGGISGSTASTVITGLLPGDYSYTVSSYAGCTSATTGPIHIQNPPVLPVVDLGEDMTVCAGQSITLNAGNAGSVYHWSEHNANTQTITVDTAGHGATTVPVWVSVNNGCVAYDTVLVTFEVCTGIAESVEEEINVFPNPTHGKVYIRTGSMNDPLIQVFSMDGKMILSAYASQLNGSANTREIDLEPYPTGIYLIRLTEGSVSVEKKTLRQ